ncbi:gamma-glutamyltransferase [Limibacillus sp. MBR-115]|jgi:gamma-glutamyltranspeptidase/glutathione hydrolase|uniref:gamma-glutamyltransferase n=1 Tax=Limibacillus sp. MBR-115 TaxID=3156465 RepID=UPI0033928C18
MASIFNVTFKARVAPLFTTLLLISACQGRPEGVLNVEYQLTGLAVSDSPQASILGQEVLLRGGRAADAAVAMSFMMASTLPSRAGIMSGGSCLIFESQSVNGDSVVFPAIQSAEGGMVPGMVRGMAALHARYGTQRWEQLLAPAESAARFGSKASRAFARDLALHGNRIKGDPDAARMYFRPDGSPHKEGELIEQPALAAVLAGVRSSGLAALYNSPFTESLALAMRQAGQPIDAAEMRGYRVAFLAPVAVPVGDQTAFFAPPPIDGGVTGAQLWTILDEVENYDGSGTSERAHLFAEASARVIAGQSQWRNPNGTSRLPLDQVLSEDYAEGLMRGYSDDRHQPPAFDPAVVGETATPGSVGGSSLVVMDTLGQAVACNFSLGEVFGSGRIAPGTGLVLGAPPSPNGKALSPLIVANQNIGTIYFGGGASGGDGAMANMVRIMLEALEEDESLRDLMSAGRFAHVGSPDTVWAERIADDKARSALVRRGHKVETVPTIGQINAFFCADSHEEPISCAVETDPRGFGLAIRAE